jgi:FtsP/CotA-like multicopper oxidase with cupredoxin domain
MAFRPHSFVLTRRRLLAGLGASVVAFSLPGRAKAEAKAQMAPDGFRILRARAGTAKLRGEKAAPTPIWGYDGLSPGPTLRVKQGEELKVRLVNELDEPTVIHWHGLRLPNAMDGVPHLTQEPVAPGKSFDYRFVAPDAGSFWYHTHFSSSEQLARGLYGVLIVDEPKPVAVDRELVLVIDDWRLADDGQIHSSFGSFHDAMMLGRLGQYITLNSEDTLDVSVKTNERLRLRIINVANSRIFQFRIAEHVARVMAIDGQACKPYVAKGGVLRLGPGARADIFLDATLSPGARAPIMIDDLRGGEIELGRLVYDAEPKRPAPLDEPEPLPANPLPTKLDIAGAFKLNVPLDGGGGMGMMMGGGAGPGPGRFPGHGLPQQERIWALAGIASSGHHGPPMFSVPRGNTVILTFGNRSRFPHAMHVHGFHFRHYDRETDGWGPYWLDTVIVDPDRAERIAFIADNPGKWMLHCHMIEHMAFGMAAWFEVT